MAMGAFMSSRGTFRLIYMIITRPREALLVGCITSFVLAVVGLFFGFRFVIGDFSKVDLSFPNADYNSIGDYTRISGSTYSAWGYFDYGKARYYIVPKFDNNSDPQYIEQALVVRIEPKDSSAWYKLTSVTKKRFTHSATEPATPIHVDGYAHTMGNDLRESALQYLQSLGFSRPDAEKTLVPNVVYYDMANKYSTLTFGGVCALLTIIFFFAWIRMKN